MGDKTPDRTWLQFEIADDNSGFSDEIASQMSEPCDGYEEYIRADLHDTLVAENAELRKERDALKAALEDLAANVRDHDDLWSAPHRPFNGCSMSGSLQFAESALARTKPGSQG